MKPDPRVPAERDGLDTTGRWHAAARAGLAMAGMVLRAALLLGGASVVALVIVRLGADWLDGLDPFSAAGRSPLRPRQFAARELALDGVRQGILALLVLAAARWADGPSWRRTLALTAPRNAGLPRRTLAWLLVVWPVVHIAWVTGTGAVFGAPVARNATLSPTLQAGGVILWLATVVVLAPVAEELLMRGFVFARGLRGAGPALTILTTAVLFAGAHVNGFGLARPVSLLPLALMLGWLRWRGGRLWPCIVLHAWSNLAMIAWVLWPEG
ncbi:CPBP family intramembrane glutamic endopeptidase [Methylobacterium sp. J-090]|uniref:CPBP family intramembrane glutamic endopeptidase n=1 Tax=Methylobacterium sp. J-090 TaxID=2836666 RepID=UPI001FBA215C|nr:CPBP family intramembrane glutamic endopeptidase [Methylobacterium sp. J-090]MCJ2082311.1 CPBP family intramembrane metalloprotease [Methylobacterium sp. J-090]